MFGCVASEGKKRKIFIFSREPYSPYDRPVAQPAPPKTTKEKEKEKLTKYPEFTKE